MLQNYKVALFTIAVVQSPNFIVIFDQMKVGL